MHATSSGMSPISLLDAASSHVSTTVIEIGRTLCIQKTTKGEQEQFSFSSGYSASAPTNRFSSSLHTVDEVKASHQWKGSTASSRHKEGGYRHPDSLSMSCSYDEPRCKLPSEPSSSKVSSPPPIFDQLQISLGGVASDESAMADGSEDTWAELKV